MRAYCPIIDRPFSETMRRVVYRLIVQAYKREQWPPNAYFPRLIHTLGQSYQLLFPELWPWFLFYSKNVAQGFKLGELRDSPLPDAARAVHKRRIHRPR